MPPSTPPTVGELIENLRKIDPDTPVIISTHYDNGIGHASQVGMRMTWMEPAEVSFWVEFNPAQRQADGDPLPPEGVHALVITAWGD